MAVDLNGSKLILFPLAIVCVLEESTKCYAAFEFGLSELLNNVKVVVTKGL